jgi:hypothetical protein
MREHNLANVLGNAPGATGVDGGVELEEFDKNRI